MTTAVHCQTSYEVLLMEYAAGTLDMAQTLIVAAHLSLSPQARRIVKDCECVGGALMDKSCDPVAMNDGSLENVLKRLGTNASPPRAAPVKRALFPEDACLPSCVESYVDCTNALRWKPLYPGIESFMLPLTCRSSRAHVFRFGPGLAAPKHSHGGLEITLVLDGAFSDGNDFHQQGSLMVMDMNDAPHAPKACDMNGCVCITVSSGDMRMTNPLMRMLSPFFRF